MTNRSWCRLRENCPVSIIPDSFFREAKNLDQKMSRIESTIDNPGTRRDLVRLNEDMTSVIQNLQKNLNKVYAEADNYHNAAKGIYKLIDINLRFYRFSEIDKQFNIMDKNKGGPSAYRLQRVLSNIRVLLKTIYESIEYANEGFEHDEEIDDNVVYLVDLASNFELSIRYFAKYQSQEEDETIDYFDELESNDMGDALDNIEEDDAEFVKESEAEMEEMFDNMGAA